MRYAIGSYTSMGGPGIAIVACDGAAMKLLYTTQGNVQDPIWIEQHPSKQKILYAACSDEGTESGRVASFALENDTVKLISVQPTGGIACCHLAVDDEAQVLYTANYVDGMVTAHRLGTDGSLEPEHQTIQLTGFGPNAERQERAHAHQIVFRPKSDEVFVCDLGSDAVMVYQRQNEGQLMLKQRISCPAGIGPRHLAFDGTDRFYLVGELGGWIACYQQRAGAWTLLQLLPTVPEEHQQGNTAAAIRMEGVRVYVSNRGYDSIAVFRKDDNGLLIREQLVTVPGSFPRDFVLLQDAFLIACQNSGTLLLTDRAGRLLDRLEIKGAVSILPLK